MNFQSQWALACRNVSEGHRVLAPEALTRRRGEAVAAGPAGLRAKRELRSPPNTWPEPRSLNVVFQWVMIALVDE